MSALLPKMSANRVLTTGAEPEIDERPGGVLTGRTASEVVSCNEYLGPLGTGLVQDEIGPGIPLPVVPPVCKKFFAESCLVGDSQESSRDYLVGIDVRRRQDDGARFDDPNCFHGQSNNSRASAIRPVTAVAAAVRGLAKNVRAPVPWRPSKFRLLVLTAY